MFASLVNCCTIDWINPWPEDALLSVSQMTLRDLDIKILTPERKESLSQLCMFAHITIEDQAERFYKMFKRKVYTTPKSYIDMLSSYGLFLTEKYNETRNYIDKLAGGLTKLKETKEIVKDLKENLVKLSPILDQKNIEQEALLKRMEVDKAEANIKKTSVEADEKVIKEKAKNIADIKADADRELAKAKPIMQGAKEALSNLSAKDLAPVKINKHEKIRFVWDSVAILLGYEKQDDTSITKMLADASLVSKMQNCDYDNLPEKISKKIKAKIASADFPFEPKTYESLQSAACPIVTWVLAVAIYIDIAKEVKIKTDKVAELTAQSNEAEAILKKKQDELAVVQAKVDELERLYTENVQEKERLDNEIETTKKRLERADKLTVLLADEQVRWADKVEELRGDIEKLVGDVFIAAASVVYIGPFTLTVRSEIVNIFIKKCEELQLPYSPDYNLIKILGDPVKVN
jgi:dynein heavy chain